MIAINIPIYFDYSSSKVEFSGALSTFIENCTFRMIEDGTLCLDMCEEMDSYYMTSLWPQGIYDECQDFL